MTPIAFASPIQRHSGVTVWRQIADSLTQELRDRTYASTGRLPSEQALAARFKVNRHTLRQALAALAEAGLIRIEQGRGAFVRKEWVDYTVSRHTRYSENMARNQLRPSLQMVAGAEQTAPATVAQALGLQPGAPVLMAELLQQADDLPIGLATMYFPAARFPGLLDRLAEGQTVSASLGHYGVQDYQRSHNRITTQLPTEALSHILRQPRTRPVLCVESVDTDTQGLPIKYGSTVFCGDRVQVLFDPQRPDG